MIGTVADKVFHGDIEADGSLCPRVKLSTHGCSACVEDCPVGAVTVGSAVEIGARCVDCGVCVASCPSGAFRSKSRSDRELLALARTVLRERGPVVAFGCAKRGTQSSQVIPVPCTGRLTEGVLLGALAEGATSVVVARCHDPACALAKGDAVFQRTLTVVRLLLRMMGRDQDAVRVVDDLGDLPAGPPPERTVDRRQAFRSFFGALAGGGDEPVNDRPSGCAGKSDKRKVLASAIARLTPSEKRAPSTAGSNGVPVPFGTITVNGACTGCPACVALCPTGALSWKEEGDKRTLMLSVLHCTACGLCRDICFFKAIACTSGIQTSDFFVSREDPLITVTNEAPAAQSNG